MENACMSTIGQDGKLPRLLSLSVHEFRTPITVVAGYIQMLLKERAGVLTDQQRRLLEESAKSCGRLSALVAEMSDLANLEAGTASFNRSAVDVRAILAEAVADLPIAPDCEVTVDLATGPGAAIVQGDPVRLKAAFTAVLVALRRELVSSPTLMVRERAGEFRGGRATWIAVADAEHIGGLEAATPETLTAFDEWRGGVGLILPVAGRIFDNHGGGIWSPLGGTKTGAVVVLPQA
jgi:light-regulated signal transduction histidine kinase (bacteriophytochrome)